MSVFLKQVVCVTLGVSAASSVAADDVQLFPATRNMRAAPQAAAVAAGAKPLADPAAAQQEAEPPLKPEEAAQLAPLMAQWEPLAKAEVSFAKRICRLDDEQRRRVVLAVKAALRKHARELIKNNNQGNAALGIGVQGIVVFNGINIRGQIPNAAESLPHKVTDAIRGLLTAPQRRDYDVELKQRQEFALQTAAENLVSMIDARVHLSAQQRQELVEGLTKSGDQSWSPPLSQFINMDGANYLPQLPDVLVLPHLTAEQKEAWRSVQKVTFGGGDEGGFQQWGFSPADDSGWDEAP